MSVTGLRAHLRNKFRPEKQTPPGEHEQVVKQTGSPNLSRTSDYVASSGSEDVNSSIEDLSADYNLDGGSLPSTAGRKLSDRRKERDSGNQLSSSDGNRRRSSSSAVSKMSAWDGTEKEIYETQLRTLQEQLVDSMIENQTLAGELKKFKSNSDMTRLLQMLDQEKDKSEKLGQECEELHQQLENVERRSYSLEESPSSVELAEEADTTDFPTILDTKSSRVYRLQEWLTNKVYEVIADFTEEPDDEKTGENGEGEELAVKKLKANIKRFKAGYQPIVQWFKAIDSLFNWKSIPGTFLAFALYMYAISRGWLITLVFGLALWHLTKMYLISKGFDIKFSLLPYPEEEEKSEVDKQLGLSDKFQLVLFVARRVQNYMGTIADGLEKLQNLLSWGSPEATQKLYTGLLCAFMVSIILPVEWFLISAGMYMGFKIFITNNIFRKFPRVKAKYDSAYILWQSLPTNWQKDRRRTLEKRKKYVIPSVVTETSQTEGHEDFTAMFSLPTEEVPLPGWHAGKRCTQIVRDKTVCFKNGRLYLTRSFLCFERARKNMEKTIVIPLADIIKIEKAKPFFLLPGHGMSIEIQVALEDKPFVFGAILNRDEVFAVILRQVCSVRDLKMRENVADSEPVNVNRTASASGDQ
ncbi:GRAM domain-containing protein 4-like [Asterias rubens]|uniref:GRAM domain-containing protein 4-like n=1 Tax=Asterias rubens TaxID=7604 RepID=UPI001454FC41|nr:GRAM domain-containing protein 4-like [Asterias rubens]